MKRLTWRDLEREFAGKWVELGECSWSTIRPLPTAATVRNAAPTRSALVSEMRRDSVLLYVPPSSPAMTFTAEGAAA